MIQCDCVFKQILELTILYNTSGALVIIDDDCKDGEKTMSEEGMMGRLMLDA